VAWSNQSIWCLLSALGDWATWKVGQILLSRSFVRFRRPSSLFWSKLSEFPLHPDIKLHFSDSFCRAYWFLDYKVWKNEQRIAQRLAKFAIFHYSQCWKFVLRLVLFPEYLCVALQHRSWTIFANASSYNYPDLFQEEGKKSTHSYSTPSPGVLSSWALNLSSLYSNYPRISTGRD